MPNIIRKRNPAAVTGPKSICRSALDPALPKRILLTNMEQMYRKSMLYSDILLDLRKKVQDKAIRDKIDVYLSFLKRTGH